MTQKLNTECAICTRAHYMHVELRTTVHSAEREEVDIYVEREWGAVREGL